MIRSPFLIVVILIGIEALVLYVSTRPRWRKYFNFLPPVFWIYFLPMLVSTAGWIDPKSPVYTLISAQVLPMSLFLLLMTVDVRAIWRLGPTALTMFFAGSAGIVLGAPLVFCIFKPWIGPDFWMGFGPLAGSWTGGSANMIAVKEAIATPEEIFTPMVIVDAVVPYVWMGILVAMVSLQPWFDRWNNADRRVLDQLSRKSPASLSIKPGRRWVGGILLILLVGFAGGMMARFIAQFLPEVKGIISTYAWTILVVSILALLVSFSPVRRLEQSGSNQAGYFLLYFVLTTIGAKASLNQAATALLLIAAGFCLVLIHLIFLLSAARLLRAPMFLVAVASQANIGGVASAPVVAEIYQPGLASVGLLLAILGNIVGTYLGILAAQLCRFFV